ncbi:MAG: dihydroorotate dehydrogenase electron transfer subunit [Deltaproteobacteria bacterium]|nr:dihydroorotate dehydrogenase electron transfer subunit [Deltaproteobacteria bacterium]
MFFQELPIKKIEPVGPEVYRLGFASREIAGKARPGQFLMIKPQGCAEPLLPRPISIHRVQSGVIELLVRVVGEGTRRITEMKAGEVLEVKGPLGRGFQIDPGNVPLLVAGGMGAAPLLFLAEELFRAGGKEKGMAPILFIGGRTKKELLALKEFRQSGLKVLAATEDGSYGEKGLVTDRLKAYLETLPTEAIVYACGPTGMLKAVASLARQEELPCQVSLEEHMACGMGACLGCAVARRQEGGPGYAKVCQDGPVFEAGEIDWDE